MKPGRKLIDMGAEQCSDSDLLSILIGSGFPGRSSGQIAAEIISTYGTLGALMGKPLSELAAIRGIGPVKAVRIAASYEMTRRILREMENNG